MAWSYVYPRVGTLPQGYNKSLTINPAIVAPMIDDAPATDVRFTYRRFFEGGQTYSAVERVRFEGGVWSRESLHFDSVVDPATDLTAIGFFQLDIESEDSKPVFKTPFPDTPYAIYWAPGRKTFMAELANKFADPRVVRQVARFGQFLQAYPAVHIDPSRDVTDCVSVINPYRTAVLVAVTSSDGRRLPRTKVPANSARRIELRQLLRAGEERWIGSVQVTSSSRVLPYFFRHRCSDPSYIIDHEHLDYYQTGSTKVAWSEYVHLELRRALAGLGLQMRPGE